MNRLNPVVQKLAEQAKGFVDLNQHVGGDNGCMIYTYEGLNKFAELIVRECCSAIRLNDVFFGGKFQGAILKHFGVEE
jgi:nitrogenase molybdenum-iron protein alpha/beta subunit